MEAIGRHLEINFSDRVFDHNNKTLYVKRIWVLFLFGFLQYGLKGFNFMLPVLRKELFDGLFAEMLLHDN